MLPALQWMALNDIDSFEAYASDFRLPEGGVSNPYVMLSFDAANLCASNSKQQGLRVLAVLEEKISYWKPEREKKAMDRAGLAPAILHCRGEKQAMQHIDDVLEQMALDVIAAQRKFTDEKDQKFVLGVIRSEVAERMIQPVVIWLHEQDREEEARDLFARLPPRAFSMTLGEVASGDLTAAEFPEQDYKQLVEYTADGYFYSDDANLALTHFVDKWDTDFELCCSDEQVLTKITEYIQADWPSDLSKRSAKKNLSLYKRLVAKKPDSINQLHLFELQLGALEKQQGCELDDARLSAYQDAVPEYKYNDQRTWTLMAYVEYLQAEKGEANGGECIIQ